MVLMVVSPLEKLRVFVDQDGAFGKFCFSD